MPITQQEVIAQNWAPWCIISQMLGIDFARNGRAAAGCC